MLTIGPVVCHLNHAETWLQITIGDDGKCSEIKQATAEDMLKNSWHTLAHDQWPTLMPIYDPATSQKHFILKREENDVINRHTIHESKHVQPSIYSVTRQTYTSTHMTAPSRIIGEAAQQLLVDFWIPESNLQEQMDKQFHAWEQAQEATIWHHDASDSDRDMPNLPLDFQKNQDGTDKPVIVDTDLNATQQWRIKSYLYEHLALLKEESISSEAYCAALRDLIDGTESTIILSDKTPSNVKDIRKIIDFKEINKHLKSDFYTKSSLDKKTSTIALEENELGYHATLGSVAFYIQHLLAAEIQQYFPQQPQPEITKPNTIYSWLKVGKLPTDGDSFERSASELSQTELRDIELLSCLMGDDTSFNSMNEQDWTHIEQVINSIQNRLAETSSIASTLRLLFSDESDRQYEEKFRAVSTKIEAYHYAKSLHNLINEEGEMLNFLPLITFKNQKSIRHAINYLSPNERVIVLHTLFLHMEKFDRRTMMPMDWIQEFDHQSQTALVQKIVSNMTEDEQNYYTQLSLLIAKDPAHVSQADKLLNEEALKAVFPRNQKETRVARLLKLQYTFSDINHLKRIHHTLAGNVLAQNIKNCFENSGITDKKEALIPWLPNLKDGDWEEADLLNQTLKNLTPEQQTEVLLTLFTTQDTNAILARMILLNEDERILSFTVLFNVMKQLSVKELKPLLGWSSVVYTLRNLFSCYEAEFQQKPSVFLSELSEEMLDKLAPQISPEQMQAHFERYYSDDDRIQIKKFPSANTTDWIQTIDAILAPFLQVKYSKEAMDKLRETRSPSEAKAWLLLQVVEENDHAPEYLVALGFQRLAEHQAALQQQVIAAEKRLQTQFESCGDVGKYLAIELELLQQKHCTEKLSQIKAAMQALPDDLTETQLQDILIDSTSDLTKALAIPALPLSNDSFKAKFRAKTRQAIPQPDFAVLLEIKSCLDKRKQQLH